MSDEETLQLFQVMKQAYALMYNKVKPLAVTDAAIKELEAWPEWVAETTTAAVEHVLYKDEADGVSK